MTVLNIAAYRFVALPDPGALVEPLRERAAALTLRGTVIVASEGVNLFLAGDGAAIDAFIAFLASDARMVDVDGRPAFAHLTIKRSTSATQPFRKLRVKQKPEIVTLRRPEIRPAAARAPVVSPETLRTWLAQGHDDDGRAVVLLDTRNAFEFDEGAFVGARHLGLERFDAFPEAIDRHLDDWRDETVVTYCTGGIRCETAALYMRQQGFARVHQLDGGILGWFERIGDAHWRGDCFVFDERLALKPDLTGRDEPSPSMRAVLPLRSPPVVAHRG